MQVCYVWCVWGVVSVCSGCCVWVPETNRLDCHEAPESCCNTYQMCWHVSLLCLLCK